MVFVVFLWKLASSVNWSLGASIQLNGFPAVGPGHARTTQGDLSHHIHA